MARERSFAECLDDLIRLRAVDLVRIHIQGRKPMADHAGHNRKRDQAFELLIVAVEERKALASKARTKRRAPPKRRAP